MPTTVNRTGELGALLEIDEDVQFTDGRVIGELFELNVGDEPGGREMKGCGKDVLRLHDLR
ncbi:hypothetical protein [Sutterella sp.]|uniref:hypothetical protein n=1 Tax=Sutterella sp. TaxID=1981025 RepID=UPI0026E068C2|nr:hypothetical protein [Sutterella sp.]MDO5531928.1 hypothetical protein [Sutterella sp.]